MSQWYKVVNLSKRQYINPKRMGCEHGAMYEFAMDRGLPLMQALALLLKDGAPGCDSSSNIYNGNPYKAMVGSWAGDHIVFAGDYALDGYFVPEEIPKWNEINLYHAIDSNMFRDITEECIILVCENANMKEYLDGLFKDYLDELYKRHNYQP